MIQGLRQAKASILADWTKRLGFDPERLQLLPVLPALLEQLEASLSDDTLEPSLPPGLAAESLPQILDEFCVLRSVLTETLPDLPAKQQNALHRFVDRCLQIATRQWNGLGQGLRYVPTPLCLVIGPEFFITFANEAYETLVGRRVVGKTMLEAYRLEEIAYFIPLVEAVFKTGVPYAENEVKVTLGTASGETEDHWMDFAYYPYGEGPPESRGILVLCYDATERVRDRQRLEHTTKRLKQTEEQLARAMAVSRVGFFDWNVRTGLVQMNEQMRRDWGCEPDALTSDELAQFVYPPDRERSLLHARTAIANKLAYADQYRVQRPNDGAVIWAEIAGEATYDAFGMPLRFFGTARNVTERKEAELTLAAEKHRFEAIFRESPTPMALWRGPEMIMELANPEFTRVLGQRAAWEMPELHSIMQQVYQSGRTYQGREIRLDDMDLDLSVTLVRDGEGQPYGVFTHAIVVTEAVSAREAARAASLAKSHFLAQMSHEIRTPLGAMLGFGALLKEPELSETDRLQYADTITRNGEALTRIIDDILDLAKVEAGRLEIESLDFSLRTMLKDILDLFRERAKAQGIYLKGEFETTADHLHSDPMRLRQILVNLIGNAVKFTRFGGVRVRVRSSPREDRSLLLTIDVMDTGIGMSEEQRDRLFQPFVQGGTSINRQFGGTGLGLALSQRLAQALDGTIQITRCIPGVGSTFSLSFPAVRAKAAIEIARPLPPQIETMTLKDITLLVVDDSMDNLYLVQRFLARSGARVLTANGGARALDLVAACQPDVVVMDIEMPEMDGYQLIQALRARGFERPVIALTAHAMMDERHLTHSAGFAAHVTKPLDSRVLLETVARLVSP